MRFPTKLTCLAPCFVTTAALSQDVTIEWQQTGINTSNVGSEFSHTAIRVDLQAILANYEHRRYAEDLGLNAGRSLTRFTLGGQYLFSASEKVAIWPRLKLHAGYGSGINGKSLTYNPQLVSIYQPSDWFALVGGAGALLHTTENQYYPVFGLIFVDSNDSRWSGNLTVPEGLIQYRINDQLSAQMGLKWQTRYYRLEEATPHYIKTQDVLLSLGYRYQFNRNTSLNLRATYATARQVRYFDVSTNFLNEINPSSTLGAHASFSYSF